MGSPRHGRAIRVNPCASACIRGVFRCSSSDAPKKPGISLWNGLYLVMAATVTPQRPIPLARLFGRALTRRCPQCGSRGLFRSWFRMKEHCPRCGLALERGEGHDYWLGAMMFNLVVSELIFVGMLLVLVIVTWPEVPWGFLQYGGVALMAIAPFVLYPFSKTIWLAWDLAFRPVGREHIWQDRR
ncbi:MAG TPA: DUF983 domain-containing protein [Gemmatimonadaceae bacterium]|nr:DUF983 domain-containing protein [Gemmatimonadaceae bacterium]